MMWSLGRDLTASSLRRVRPLAEILSQLEKREK
jgi:hypothetical protein